MKHTVRCEISCRIFDGGSEPAVAFRATARARKVIKIHSGSSTDTSIPGNTNWEPRQEPTSGEGREMADRMGAVWDQELEGWVYIDMVGDRVFIYYNGGSKVLYN